MKIRNRHERTIMAQPGRVAALIADFGRIWPTQVAPAPRPQGHHIYRAGPVVVFRHQVSRLGGAQDM